MCVFCLFLHQRGYKFRTCRSSRSRETSFCHLPNVFRRLCPLMRVCLSTPAWLHLLDISIFAISTHSILTHLYSLQHPLLLMLSLSLFATCHRKKCCHWQSVLCRYKDRPPKGNCNSTRDRGHTRVPNETCCCLQGKGNSTIDRGLTRVPKEPGFCL